MVKTILLRDDSGPFIIGEPIFIRTITYHLTGKIIAIKGKFLVLDEAAWIADDGRFTQAINDGILNEVEPVEGPVRVNIDSIVDAYHWAHSMPRKQK
jgi:hypothetical protein